MFLVLSKTGIVCYDVFIQRESKRGLLSLAIWYSNTAVHNIVNIEAKILRQTSNLLHLVHPGATDPY